MLTLRGCVHKFGANIDTDVIIPAHYLNMYTPEELAPHCLEGVDPEFARRVRPGDVILAETNFGCGSSREHAPLPILECPEAVDGSDPGDELAIELESGTIRNLTKEMQFQAKPYPEFMLELLAAGGLVEYTKRRLAAGRRP